MSLLQRSAIVTAMLASLTVSSFAQTTNAPAAAPTAQSAPAPAKKAHGPEAREAREAHMAKRMQALKASLKLNANQETAWNSYIAAVKPQRPAPEERPERPDFAKLTTPERIDAMQAMHTKHQAAMDQRNQATKAFYASLTPEQQKVFDERGLRHPGEGKGKGDQRNPRGHGHHGGPGPR